MLKNQNEAVSTLSRLQTKKKKEQKAPVSENKTEDEQLRTGLPPVLAEK